MITITHVIWLTLLAVYGAFADSWMPPTPQTVASPSATYLVRIEPDDRKEQPDPSKCRALIYAFDADTGEYRRTKELSLPNPVVPVNALIRDDGRYLVTFDDYYSIGYGDNLIVIHDLLAGSVTRLKLEDFLRPDQIAGFRASTSSRHWRGEVTFRGDQQDIYIGSAGDPFKADERFPSYILDLDTKKVAWRMEQPTTQATRTRFAANDTALIGGILGGVLGLLGGVTGTYFSIRNTKTPAERRFAVRVSIWVWIGVSVFLAVLFVLPAPWRWLAWLPYAVILPLAIGYMNRRQNSIRESTGE